jgi:hypothetical protein
MMACNFKSIIQDSISKIVQSDPSPDTNISIYLEELGDNNYIKSENLFPQEYYYPASLIKLFDAYLAKIRLQQQLPDLIKEKTPSSPSFGARNIVDDVYDAIHESLKTSDNDALGFLVDFNSNTCSGLRLDAQEFLKFKNARKSISDFFIEQGYSADLNLANKCFSFAPYGRERQLVFEENGLGSNKLRIDDVARVMRDIIQNYPELLSSMSRKIADQTDEQTEFIAKGLEPFADKVQAFYSKAGWTSRVRHDSAYIKMKNSQEFIFVIMTNNLSQFPALIPEITQEVFKTIS